MNKVRKYTSRYCTCVSANTSKAFSAPSVISCLCHVCVFTLVHASVAKIDKRVCGRRTHVVQNSRRKPCLRVRVCFAPAAGGCCWKRRNMRFVCVCVLPPLMASHSTMAKMHRKRERDAEPPPGDNFQNGRR